MMTKALENRLARVEGQIRKLQTLIKDEQPCEQVIPQFLAVKGAVSAALESYVASSMQECTMKDKVRLETLIKTLVKL